MGFLSFVGNVASIFNPAIGAGIHALDKGIKAFDNAKANGGSDFDAIMASANSLMTSNQELNSVGIGDDDKDHTKAYGKMEPAKYEQSPSYQEPPGYSAARTT